MNKEQCRNIKSKINGVKMPLTLANCVALPNDFVRSALFIAADSTNQRALKHEKIASFNGTELYYTGWQLNQGHLAVFEGVVSKSRGLAEGEIATFSATELLKLIGRHTGKTEHDWLYKTLIELSANSLVILKNKDRFFNNQILRVPGGSVVKGSYQIEITKDILSIFYPNHTILRLDHRQALKRKPLARWLHAFVTSHKAPYDITVQRLYELSGSKASELWIFRQKLRQAISDLKAAGVIADGAILSDDKVSILRF